MKLQQLKEPCPLCGEPNSTSLTHCCRCRYRLPWADALEGTVREHAPQKEAVLDRELKRVGLLSQRTVRCRYCEQPIGIDDKQCPHCRRWLISRFHEFEIDPWQKDFRKENVQHVDMIGPFEKGAWGVLQIFFLGIAFCVTLFGVGWLLSKLLP